MNYYFYIIPIGTKMGVGYCNEGKAGERKAGKWQQ